jgi:hypothetical protein
LSLLWQRPVSPDASSSAEATGTTSLSERAQKIQPGRTTVREVLKWLGPPAAIAQKGKTVVFPAPSIGRTDSLEMQSDGFFELFSSDRSLREHEVVYYFDASRESSFGVIGILIIVNFGGQTDRAKVERLWLLVDESTGIVEDYLYRSGGRNIRGDASRARTVVLK